MDRAYFVHGLGRYWREYERYLHHDKWQYERILALAMLYRKGVRAGSV